MATRISDNKVTLACGPAINGNRSPHVYRVAHLYIEPSGGQFVELDPSEVDALIDALRPFSSDAQATRALSKILQRSDKK